MLTKSKNICVLGAGNWGTTLAVILAEQGHRVRLWEYLPQAAEEIQRTRQNRQFLPGITIPAGVTISSDLEHSLQGAGICFLALPSPVLRPVCLKAYPLMPANTVIVSAIKGLEDKTHLRMSQVIVQTLKEKTGRLVVLSGPNIASEIARHLPATTVAVSHDPAAAEEAQSALMSPYLRVYTGSDVVGAELGGSLKNVIAIAAGIIDGLELGANTKGALLTRGLAEITRLGTALGADPATFAGLSGMGDLITTCSSQHSRNHTVGTRIGRGQKIDDILKEMVMVAEGVNTAKAAYELSQEHKIKMPITEQMYLVLFQGKPPRQTVEALMTRDPKSEK
ncbi:NAD(P)-dependent glycerol-3-phosphate dehydrogenase [candidate division TA06 bacterium]|uniref:Glycerol-3-phosphate dehydrogenase [NAD(P)+] n=1 Tax=candidate division TA06 bacterium TaxID=2250710 RepID=A0A933IBA1_UNCT6|nr:NAD(P)-dependent glycerol-3-phosphate dehydrogenase [candidate division TA06 bacterium]